MAHPSQARRNLRRTLHERFSPIGKGTTGGTTMPKSRSEFGNPHPRERIRRAAMAARKRGAC